MSSTVTAISHPKTRADYLAEREAFAGDAVAALEAADEADPNRALILLAQANTLACLASSAATAALVADDD